MTSTLVLLSIFVAVASSSLSVSDSLVTSNVAMDSIRHQDRSTHTEKQQLKYTVDAAGIPAKKLTKQLNKPRVLQTVISICKVYDDNGKCVSCFRDQYMNNSVCVDVPDDKLISRCNIYSMDLKCEECDAGYLLTSDKSACNAGPASLNCLEYIDNATCKSCKPGSYLSNGACILIPNCAEVSATQCKVCTTDYYLDQSTGTASCKQVESSKKITNCIAYSSDQLCSACKSGLALSLDKKTCLTAAQVNNQIDPNCSYTFASNGDFCSACIEGFYLSNGVCVACSQSDSCLICDPKKPTNCLLCKPKYYMLLSIDNIGTCVLNGEVSKQLEQRDPLSSHSSLPTTLLGVLLILMEALF